MLKESEEIVLQIENLMTSESFDDAKAYLEKKLQDDPDNLSLRATKCKVLIYLNEFKAAVDTATDMLALDMDCPDAFFYMGLAQRFNGELEVAIKNFDIALMNGYDSVVVWRNIGSAYGDMGDIEKATIYFEKILEHDEKNITDRVRYAKLLIAFGYFIDALRVLDEIIALVPVMESAYEFKGEILVSLSRAEEAQTVCEKAIAMFKNNFELKVILVKALILQQKLGEAQTMVDELMKENPEHNGLKLAQGRILLLSDKTKQGLKVLDDVMKNDEGLIGAEARYNSMLVNASIGNFDDVLTIAKKLEKAEAIGEYQLTAVYYKCVAMEKKGMPDAKSAYKKAIEMFEKDIEKNGNRAMLFRILSYIAIEDVDTAKRIIDDMLSIYDETDELSIAQYVYYKKTGDKELAEQHLKNAKNVNPLIKMIFTE